MRVPLHCPGPHDKQVKGYPETPRSLGEHLRKRRLDLGQTQVQAAARFGISVTAYNGWEAGRIAPEIAKWPEVVRFLGYDPSPAPTTFGEAVVALRRSLGLDRPKLAARLGVDVKSALNWESGRTLPVSRLRHRLSRLAPELFLRYESGWE